MFDGVDELGDKVRLLVDGKPLQLPSEISGLLPSTLSLAVL